MDHRAPHIPRRRAGKGRVVALAALTMTLGCAQGPLTSRYTTIGSLKANVAQLESEKDRLQRERNELQAENRRVQDQLVQAETTNDDLITRLDNARNLIRGQGGDITVARPDLDPSPHVAPAGRSQRRSRKSPVTQIPGVQTIPDPDQDRYDGFEPFDNDPQARRGDDSPWLPMARGRPRSSDAR
ncbi:MAG: cell division protein ZapB [Isosphaeraceae bacterium]